MISIACKQIVQQMMNNDFDHFGTDKHNETTTSIVGSMQRLFQEQDKLIYTPIEILTSLCLLIGLIQFCLCFLRFGVIATLISDPITSSFCVSGSVHVVASQLFSLLGIDTSVSDNLNEPKMPFELVQVSLNIKI